jgi:hypothetical protein
MVVYEIVLALVAGLTAFRYGWRFVPDTHDPSPPCERTVALMNDMDRTGSEGKP